jgi:hypothetical protein
VSSHAPPHAALRYGGGGPVLSHRAAAAVARAPDPGGSGGHRACSASAVSQLPLVRVRPSPAPRHTVEPTTPRAPGRPTRSRAGRPGCGPSPRGGPGRADRDLPRHRARLRGEAQAAAVPGGHRAGARTRPVRPGVPSRSRRCRGVGAEPIGEVPELLRGRACYGRLQPGPNTHDPHRPDYLTTTAPAPGPRRPPSWGP